MEVFILGIAIKIIVAILILLVIYGIISTMIFSVPEKHAYSITTFGKYSRIARAGLNFKLPPPIQMIDKRASLQINNISIEIEAKTKDNAFIRIPVRLQYSIIVNKDESIYNAMYMLDEIPNQISSYVSNTIRNSVSKIDFVDIYSNKDTVERNVKEDLDEKFNGYGYEINNVLVEDPKPSNDMKDAFQRVIISQKEKEAAINIGEALKIKKTKEAEAEGLNMTIKAEAYAKARDIMAAGNAKAILEFKKDIPDLSSKDVIDFIAGTDFRDTIKEVGKNGKLVWIGEGSYNNSNTIETTTKERKSNIKNEIIKGTIAGQEASK